MTQPQIPQQPSARSSNSCLYLILICAGLGAAAVIALAVIFNTAPPPPEVVNIHPRVKASLTELTIINTDKLPYEQVEIVLNPSGVLQTGYSKKLPRIEPGQTVTIGLSNFSNSDDERYQSLRTKLRAVNVFAKVGGKDAVATFVF